ncbi:hypothetical protein AK812_SmicGene13898 [Symbiodinium microadriaticum]|uniref:Uncharacterized protein n=1 Tax=Symbiodinium microadriaticum TaxID=2951 RepID=A0A1Q9E6Y8_SYMMI|nr:hypothetical protein AK812_SmicGene13898 [Symbiodinium microadriaticum]
MRNAKEIAWNELASDAPPLLLAPLRDESGWSSASQFVPTSAIVKAHEAVQQCLAAQGRFRCPPAEVLDGLLGTVGSSQIVEFQAAEEPAGFDQADGLLTQAAGRVPRVGSLQGRTRAVLHQVNLVVMIMMMVMLIMLPNIAVMRLMTRMMSITTNDTDYDKSK